MIVSFIFGLFLWSARIPSTVASLESVKPSTCQWLSSEQADPVLGTGGPSWSRALQAEPPAPRLLGSSPKGDETAPCAPPLRRPALSLPWPLASHSAPGSARRAHRSRGGTCAAQARLHALRRAGGILAEESEGRGRRGGLQGRRARSPFGGGTLGLMDGKLGLG